MQIQTANSEISSDGQTRPVLELAAELERFVAVIGPVVVAFSGGVDSSVVAAAAFKTNPSGVSAVTARSPSVAGWQLELARTIAKEIGITHHVIETDEGTRAEYIVNDSRRCFYCKQTLYRGLAEIAGRYDATILSGTNADDLGDYRPGIEAGRLAEIQTPLSDLGFGKSTVRRLASHYGLSNHQLPASPCLASRIAYGVEVTPARLARVEQAEDAVRSLGFSDVRVRHHADDLARLEVPLDETMRLMQLLQETNLRDQILATGFKYVCVDAAGLRSGNLNQVLVQIK